MNNLEKLTYPTLFNLFNETKDEKYFIAIYNKLENTRNYILEKYNDIDRQDLESEMNYIITKILSNENNNIEHISIYLLTRIKKYYDTVKNKMEIEQEVKNNISILEKEYYEMDYENYDFINNLILNSFNNVSKRVERKVQFNDYVECIVNYKSIKERAQERNKSPETIRKSIRHVQAKLVRELRKNEFIKINYRKPSGKSMQITLRVL